MTQWTGQSKGSALGYKIFLYSVRYFGIRSAYFILFFVSFFYFFFAKEARQNLFEFYTKSLKYSYWKTLGMVRRNFFVFGQVLIDRSAFLIGKKDHYSYESLNENAFEEALKEGKGAVVLCAHYGNWEIAGNLLQSRLTAKINVVMRDNEVQAIKKAIESTTGGAKFNPIAIGDDLSHVFEIKNALSRNEIVAIHADRTMENGKNVEVEFFGNKLNLPYGPFVLAAKLGAPVLVSFAYKKSLFKYQFEAHRMDVSKQKIEDIAQVYSNYLQQKVSNDPHQWYNYYNYYNQ